jgi:hypothetical protein
MQILISDGRVIMDSLIFIIDYSGTPGEEGVDFEANLSNNAFIQVIDSTENSSVYVNEFKFENLDVSCSESFLLFQGLKEVEIKKSVISNTTFDNCIIFNINNVKSFKVEDMNLSDCSAVDQRCKYICMVA